MNRLLVAICTTALLLGLAACGQSGSESPDSSVSTAPASTASEPAAATQITTPTPSSSPAASEEAEPSPSQEPTEVAKTYRMNKNYFIVPIDEERTESKVVLLTFDDGPKDSKTLDPILDTLDKHHAKAIFFVNGYRVKANPDLLKKIDERRQIIGNHSWDHIELKKEKAPKIKEQIESVQAIIKEVTGKTPVFFRPPFASANDAVRQIAKENGLLFMT